MNTDAHPGRIIMFDGPDGVGKTTQIKLLAEHYVSVGMKVLVYRIPGGTPIGEALRAVSLDNTLSRPPLTDLYISLSYHAALADELQHHRSQGAICLMDRSPLSIIAYQSYASGLELAITKPEVDKVMSWYTPDAVVYLKATDRTLVERRRTNNKKDYFEAKGEPYMQKVQAGFDDVAVMYGCRTITADGLENDVTTALIDELQDLVTMS